MISNSQSTQVRKGSHVDVCVLRHMNKSHLLILMMGCVAIPIVFINYIRPLVWELQQHMMENLFHRCKLQKIKFKTINLNLKIDGSNYLI